MKTLHFQQLLLFRKARFLLQNHLFLDRTNFFCLKTDALFTTNLSGCHNTEFFIKSKSIGVVSELLGGQELIESLSVH